MYGVYLLNYLFWEISIKKKKKVKVIKYILFRIGVVYF